MQDKNRRATCQGLSKRDWTSTLLVLVSSASVHVTTFLVTGFLGRSSIVEMAAYGSAITILDFLVLAPRLMVLSGASSALSGCYGAAIAAQREGRGDDAKVKLQEAKPIIAKSITLSMALSVSVGLCLYASGRELLAWLSLPPAVVQAGVQYLRIIGFGMLIGGVGHFPFQLIFVLRRLDKDSLATPLLVLQAGLEAALAYGLVFGKGPLPTLGIGGAAVAQVVSQCLTTLLAGAAFLVGFSVKGLPGKLCLTRADFAAAASWGALVRKGGPSLLEQALRAGAGIIVNKVAGMFGTETVAALSGLKRVLQVVLVPGFALAEIADRLVGRHKGAGEVQRAVRAGSTCATCYALLMTLAGGLLWFGGDRVFRCFTSDPEVIRIGAQALRIVGVTFPFMALFEVLRRGLVGGGDAKSPMWIVLAGRVCVASGLIILLAAAVGLDSRAVFIAIAVSNVIEGLLTAWVFTKGKWRR